MKKVIYICALFGIALASCKKDGKSPSKPDPDNNNKTYEVSFNVGIDASSKTISTKSAGGQKINADIDISDVASFLAYFVYNAQNKLVSHYVQDSTLTNFGSVNDNLQAGTYTVMLLATDGKPTLYNDEHFVAIGRDNFYKKFTLTVTNSAVTQNINLERRNGQLEIKILDAIPQGTNSISYEVSTDRALNIADGLPGDPTYLRSYVKKIPTNLIGTTNYSFLLSLTNTDRNLRVIINSATGKKVVIDSVKVMPNTRTVLSGNLFDVNSAGFNASYDQAFETDTTIVEF
ncbi:hypothetical protein LT679_02510 [Mucilaginibacter roseus]|uniref:DUF4397 domain-containing protein n=1 Tax=Mucilaginibacter roseus TaxID=1528868 RepID=A0ABS8TYK1_9SPHI|nr:hypothetical protein [Mucilaginibacter roseus]MCD8739462.1 hypothetical protein [Mucilaginibacter roseus]